MGTELDVRTVFTFTWTAPDMAARMTLIQLSNSSTEAECVCLRLDFFDQKRYLCWCLKDRERKTVTSACFSKLLNKTVTNIQPKVMELIKFYGTWTAYHTGHVQRKCELSCSDGVMYWKYTSPVSLIWYPSFTKYIILCVIHCNSDPQHFFFISLKSEHEDKGPVCKILDFWISF